MMERVCGPWDDRPTGVAASPNAAPPGDATSLAVSTPDPIAPTVCVASKHGAGSVDATPTRKARRV
jgi:hypothetical protein